MSNRRGGIIHVQVNGESYDVAGNWQYEDDSEERTGLVGADGVHGYKALPHIPAIYGTIRDRGGLDLKKLKAIDGATITLALPTGKIAVLQDAWFAGPGTGGTEEGDIAARFEGKRMDYVDVA